LSAGRATCATPIAWEDLVAYWADELDAEAVDRVDEHVMGCATCSAESARVSAVTTAIRAMIPPIIDHARLESIRAAGHVVRDNVLAPDVRRPAAFDASTDFLVHRLQIDLSRAAKVEVRVTVEESGATLLVEPSAPFDRDSGEILVACQRHFANFPPNIVIEVHAHEAQGPARVARYPVPHVFERRAGE
jgi:hypothetical protein